MKLLLMLIALNVFTPYQYRLTPVNDTATCMDLNDRQVCDSTHSATTVSCGSLSGVTPFNQKVFYLYADEFTEQTGSWYVLRLDTIYYQFMGRYFVKTEQVWEDGAFVNKDLMYLTTRDGNDSFGAIVGVIDYSGRGWLTSGECVELFPRFECYR